VHEAVARHDFGADARLIELRVMRGNHRIGRDRAAQLVLVEGPARNDRIQVVRTISSGVF
jgi:hypothetical protein